MAVVAGTPVIESPTARVTTFLPATVTRTSTAFRCACVMKSRTIRMTASALAPLLVGDEAGPVRGGAQPASSPRARTEHPRRRKTGMRRSYRKAAKPVKA